MAVFNAAFPIQPGKLEVAKAFGRDAMGARRSGLDEFQGRKGIMRETWAIQEMPDGGGLSVVWVDSPDMEKTFALLASDPSEFAVWFRARVKEINGIDLATTPLPPAPTVTLDWSAQV